MRGLVSWVVKPSDLHDVRERKLFEEHDRVFGGARGDVDRLFDHFGQRVGEYGVTAALLALATVLAVPEDDLYA